MTAAEMLPVFKKMLSDYKIAYHALSDIHFGNDGDFYLSFEEDINRGFCNWIFRKAFLTADYHDLLRELYKDYKPISNEFFVSKILEHYWYPVLNDCYDVETSLLPRIENLERTIARLEKITNEKRDFRSIIQNAI